MSNMQETPNAPDPQDPITVAREDLRALMAYVIAYDSYGLWREAFVRDHPRQWVRHFRRLAEALGEWPVNCDDWIKWITLEEARERWGE